MRGALQSGERKEKSSTANYQTLSTVSGMLWNCSVNTDYDDCSCAGEVVVL